MSVKKILLLISFYLTFSLQLLAAQGVVEKIRFINDLGKPVEMSIEAQDELKSRIGDDFDSAKLMQDVSYIKESMPQFQNIVTQINPIDGDDQVIEIIFELQMVRNIQNIRILSNADLKLPTNIRKKLLLQRNGTFDAKKLEKDKKTMTEFFVAQGYPKAVVEHETLLSANKEDIALTYMIKPTTAQLVITDLNISGAKSFKKKKIKGLIESKPRSFFLQRHPNFSLQQLKSDVLDVKRFYKESGFFNAKVEYEYEFFHDGTTTLEIIITEGKRYPVKEFIITHNDEITSEQEIREIAKLDDFKYYNDKQLRQSLQAIREYFGERGHAKIQALASYIEEKDAIHIKIHEGPIVYIRNVILQGNQKMDARKVLLDVDIKQGERFNAAKLNQTLKDMRATGFYSDVRVDFEPTSETQGNIIVLVKEARTRTITFGAGTGTNGLMGELSFSDRNFLNSGKSVSLHLRRTMEMTKIGLVYRDPHLFESDYAFKASTNYKDDNRDDFDEKRIGAVLMIEKKITENLKLGVGTRIEFLNLSDIDEEIRLADHHADGEDRIVGLVGTLFYKNETRDKAGDIKDGLRIKMALLPSYADQGTYVKAFSTVMATKSLWENESGVAHTVSGRITIGYTSENTPFYEKFYAGGAGTLKGYKRKSIKTDEGDGGQILLGASLAYSFPIWEETVKGVVFLEAAAIGDNVDDLGNFRAVGGFGVKANLMDTFLGSMIEAGVAVPLNKKEGDELRPFYFIFGDYDPAYDL